jgi:hypothetical protein
MGRILDRRYAYDAIRRRHGYDDAATQELLSFLEGRLDAADYEQACALLEEEMGGEDSARPDSYRDDERYEAAANPAVDGMAAKLHNYDRHRRRMGRDDPPPFRGQPLTGGKMMAMDSAAVRSFCQRWPSAARIRFN